MIKELIRVFTALVDSLYTKPVATVFAILILAVGYIALHNYQSLQYLVVTPDEEAARFQKQLESSDTINQVLDGLRVELGADNVLIRQFHNGRHDLTGIPFTGISTTFYVDPLDNMGHEPMLDEPISAANKSLRQVWQRVDRPQCTIIYFPVDISTSRYFKTHGLNKMAMCPLVNLLNYPIGVLMVGFAKDNGTSPEVILEKTSSISKNVTGYLNNGY